MASATINLWAVLVCAVFSNVLGGLWYGKLFMKPWLVCMGWDKLSKKQMEAKTKGAGKGYAISFALSLLMFYILAHFIDYVNATTWMQGAETGFWMWLGFVVPTNIAAVLWEEKPVKLYYIFIAYQLVLLCAGGALLACWV